MLRQQSEHKVRRGLLFRGLAAISLLAALFLSACAEEVVISNVAASGITDASATITWATSATATSQVEYGTTTSYGSETTLSTTLVSAHSVNLTGLSASTTFYYRVKSGEAVSAQRTFSTTEVQPVIYDIATSGIRDVSTTITWATSVNGSSQVEYGTTTSYGSETTLSTTLVSAHSVDLAGLTANTTYYYRVKSSGAVSAQGTFRTVKDIAAITADWEVSDHNNMEYLTTIGTDTWCGRCHAPFNWDPGAMYAGPAGGCFNHKGPGTGPGWNMKTLGNEAVADPVPIGCTVCHEEGIGPDIAIWNNGTMGYDAVATTDELCGKCHNYTYGGRAAVPSPSDKAGDKGTATAGTATSLTDTTQDFLTTVAVGMTVFNETDNSLATVAAVVNNTTLTTTALIGRVTHPAANFVSDLTWQAGDKYWIYQGPLIPGGAITATVNHQIIVGGSAHPNQIGMVEADGAPRSCVDCHSTHTRAADCRDCHTSLATATPTSAETGHDLRMAKVTCVGCHAGDLTDMGWNADKTEFTSGVWSTSTRPPYATTFATQNTHIISRVGKACAACHYAANPWGLPVP